MKQEKSEKTAIVVKIAVLEVRIRNETDPYRKEELRREKRILEECLRETENRVR
jgi:hypothetical protein